MPKKVGVFALGLTNDLGNGRFLFFGDYDGLTLNQVEKEISRLVRRHNLRGPIFYRRSKRGCHVLDIGAVDQFSMEELDTLLGSTPVDAKFRNCLMCNGENTIRVTPKFDGEFGPWYSFKGNDMPGIAIDEYFTVIMNGLSEPQSAERRVCSCSE
jgi:hypothetical protein